MGGGGVGKKEKRAAITYMLHKSFLGNDLWLCCHPIFCHIYSKHDRQWAYSSSCAGRWIFVEESWTREGPVSLFEPLSHCRTPSKIKLSYSFPPYWHTMTSSKYRFPNCPYLWWSCNNTDLLLFQKKRWITYGCMKLGMLPSLVLLVLKGHIWVTFQNLQKHKPHHASNPGSSLLGSLGCFPSLLSFSWSVRKSRTRCGWAKATNLDRPPTHICATSTQHNCTYNNMHIWDHWFFRGCNHAYSAKIYSYWLTAQICILD